MQNGVIYPYAQLGPMVSMRQSGTPPASAMQGLANQRTGSLGGSGGGGGGGANMAGASPAMQAQRQLQEMQQLNQMQLQLNQMQQLRTLQQQGGQGAGGGGGAMKTGGQQKAPMQTAGPNMPNPSNFSSLMQAASSSGMTAAALRGQLPPSVANSQRGMIQGSVPNPKCPLRDSHFPLPRLQKPLKKKGQEPDYSPPKVDLASFRGAWKAFHKSLEGKRLLVQPIREVVRDEFVTAIYRGRVDIVSDKSVTGVYSVNKPAKAPTALSSRRREIPAATTIIASTAGPKSAGMKQQLNNLAGGSAQTGMMGASPGLNGLMNAAMIRASRMGPAPGPAGMGMGMSMGMGMGTGMGMGIVPGGGGGGAGGGMMNVGQKRVAPAMDDPQNIGKKKKPKKARMMSKNFEGAAALAEALLVSEDGAPTITFIAPRTQRFSKSSRSA